MLNFIESFSSIKTFRFLSTVFLACIITIVRKSYELDFILKEISHIRKLLLLLHKNLLFVEKELVTKKEAISSLDNLYIDNTYRFTELCMDISFFAVVVTVVTLTFVSTFSINTKFVSISSIMVFFSNNNTYNLLQKIFEIMVAYYQDNFTHICLNVCHLLKIIGIS